jgi:hypothetical protein
MYRHNTLQNGWIGMAALLASTCLSAHCAGQCCAAEKDILREQQRTMTLRAMGLANDTPAADSTFAMRANNDDVGEYSRKAAQLSKQYAGTDKRRRLEMFQDVMQLRYGKPLMENDSKLFNVALPSRTTIMNDPSFLASSAALGDAVAAGDESLYIINGIPDTSDKFRAVVAVGNDDRFFCTGTLIDQNTVLCAAHCAPAIVTRIFIGRDVDNPGAAPKYYEASIDGTPSSYYPPNDILVIKLTRAVDPEDAIPFKIATKEQLLGAPYVAIVGFGNNKISTDGEESGFGVRRWGTVAWVKDTLSVASTARTWGCRFEYEFATQAISGVASCHGDSGGPVFIRDSGTKSYLLAGIVSRALPVAQLPGHLICGDGAVNTLVSKYVAGGQVVLPPPNGR